MSTDSNDNLRFGDVYWVAFDGIGHEQSGYRPAVIIQNDKGNTYSPNTIVFPVTTSKKGSYMPTHVFLPARETGLSRDSTVLCENPDTVSKDRVGAYITTLPEKYIEQIKVGGLVSTPFLGHLSASQIATLLRSVRPA